MDLVFSLVWKVFILFQKAICIFRWKEVMQLHILCLQKVQIGHF